MKKIWIALVIAFACSAPTYAQDPLSSQFNNIPLYLNPALTGMGQDYNPRLTFNFRDQWPSISNAFMSYAASFDCYFPDAKSGVGILLGGDRAGGGTFYTNTLNLFYSFNARLSKKCKLRFGVRGAWYNQALIWDKLEFVDMYGPQFGDIYNSAVQRPDDICKNGFDLGAGVLFYTKNFYVGFAADHLVPMNLGYLSQTYYLSRKYTAHAGYKGFVRRQRRTRESLWDLTLSPYVIMQNQARFYHLNYGVNVFFNPIIFGISARHTFFEKIGRYIDSDAVTLSAGVQFELRRDIHFYDQLRVVYSYDFTTSKLALRGGGGGAHEISLQYNHFITCTHCPKRIFNPWKEKYHFESPVY